MSSARVIRPAAHGEWQPDRMGKSTLYDSAQLMVGLNAFEPGQAHASHTHAGTDKLYFVLEGEGQFTLGQDAMLLRSGDMLVAPAGVPHGVANTGSNRLLVLVAMAPSPSAR